MVIETGQTGLMDVTISVSNTTSPRGTGAVNCQIGVQNQATTSAIVTSVVSCAATGRYVMLWTPPPETGSVAPPQAMELCR